MVSLIRLCGIFNPMSSSSLMNNVMFRLCVCVCVYIYRTCFLFLVVEEYSLQTIVFGDRVTKVSRILLGLCYYLTG